MPFLTRTEYEHMLYRVQDDYPDVERSTLRLYSASALTAIVEGSIFISNGLEVRVIEVLDFKVGRIQHYSYTLYRGETKVRWYDSQPHREPELASTFPHHLHEPPDIKHNRKPAPGISFSEPNLPTLIADCMAIDTE